MVGKLSLFLPSEASVPSEFVRNSSNGRAIAIVPDAIDPFSSDGWNLIVREGFTALTWLSWKTRSSKICPFVVFVAKTTGVETSTSSNEKHAIEMEID